jgi:hypothetical protein
VSRGAYRERLSTTRLLRMAYNTKHSHTIVLYSSWGKQDILVRMIKMQLGSIELLYVNTQPLYKVKIIKRMLSFAQQRKKVSHELHKCWPLSSSSNLLDWHHNHLCHNEMQDLNKNEQRQTRTLLPWLALKAAWKVTRLRWQGSSGKLGFGESKAHGKRESLT